MFVKIRGGFVSKFVGRLRGFTMVEVVIMLGIIVAISIIVIFSFPALNQGVLVQRSAQELALLLRKAQNDAFGVTVVGTAAPQGFGVHVANQSSLAFLFADFNNNKVYDIGDTIMESIRFERGVTLTTKNAADNEEDELNIVFATPDATMTISNASLSIGESAKIEVFSQDKKFKKILRIITTGQITIE